jgi:hypothetical protein
VKYYSERRMDKVSVDRGICWSTVAPRIPFWEKVVVVVSRHKLIRTSELEIRGRWPQRN